MVGTVAGWAVGVAVVSLYMNYASGEEAKGAARDQSAASRRSLEAQQRSSDIAAQRERIKQERLARIARAEVINSSTTLGTGTSGVAGATSSIGSQVASNTGNINVTQGFAEQASIANQQGADAASRGAQAQATAAQWQAIGSTAMTIWGMRAGAKVKKAGE